jgi:hypothetical protein
MKGGVRSRNLKAQGNLVTTNCSRTFPDAIDRRCGVTEGGCRKEQERTRKKGHNGQLPNKGFHGRLDSFSF